MERSEHCTHPEQTWCDCDWCRLVRAFEPAFAKVLERMERRAVLADETDNSLEG